LHLPRDRLIAVCLFSNSAFLGFSLSYSTLIAIYFCALSERKDREFKELNFFVDSVPSIANAFATSLAILAISKKYLLPEEISMTL
jgi:hypothetical protein